MLLAMVNHSSESYGLEKICFGGKSTKKWRNV